MERDRHDIPDIQEAVLTLRAEGAAIVLVEQCVDTVLKMADRVAFMVAGRVETTLPVAGLAPDAPALRTYVGV